MKQLLCMICLFAGRAFAQNCDDAALAQQPGTWKEGLKGSVSGIPAATLSIEKKNTLALHTLIKQNYTPKGLEAVTAHAYQRVYPEMIVYPHYFAIYLMEKFCSDGKTKTSHETNSHLFMHVNQAGINFSHDAVDGFIDDADKDHYGWLDRMPEFKNGCWYMEMEKDAALGTRVLRRQWLITYPGKQPFRFVTRKEYLDKSAYMYRKFRDNADAGTKKYYAEKLAAVEKVMRSLSAKEMEAPAIVPRMGDFTGFLQEGERFAVVLVKENPAYYNRKIAPAIPQLFFVELETDTRSPALSEAGKELKAAINTTALQAMLGK